MWQQQQGQPNANDGSSNQGWQANGSWPAGQQQQQPPRQQPPQQAQPPQQGHHAQPQHAQQQQYQIQYANMLRQQQQQQSQHAQQQQQPQASQRQMSAGSANHGYPSAHAGGATSPLNTPGGVVEPSVLTAFRQAANGSGLQPHQRHQSSGQRTPGVQPQQQSNFPPHFNPNHNGVSPGSTQPHPPQGWSQFVPPSVLTPSHEAARFNLGGNGNPHQQQQFHPHHQQQQQQQQFAQQRQQMQQLHHQQLPGQQQGGAEDDDGDKKAGGPGQKQGTSDFVKKLFTMLDDLSYSSIVSWSNVGDSFVVRNMNDFTKHVLPRHFRHSNFASFVRQLNKYDFHKVKNPEEQASQPADQIWEFKHPDFVRGREDLLENVRRKLPSGKKKTGEDRDNSPTMPNASEAAERGAEEYNKLKDQIANLTATQDMMSSHIDKLTKQYQGVIGEMLTFQKNMVQQDQLMQNLIQYLMNLENDRKITASAPTSAPVIAEGPFLSAQETQRLVGSYDQVLEASFGQMSEIAQRQQQQHQQSGGRSPRRDGGLAATPSGASPRSQAAGSTLGGNLSPKSYATGHSPSTTAGRDATSTPASSAKTPGVSGSSSHTTTAASSSSSALKHDPTQANHQDHNMFLHPPHLDNDESSTLFNTAANSVSNPTLAGFEGAGLRVFTVGTLQPREGAGEGVSPSTLDAAFARSANKERSPSSGPDKQAFGLSVPPIESLPAHMPKLDKRTTSTNPTPNPHGDGEGSNSRSGTPSEGGSNLLRVRRSTYVPGWAVPPRVLLVDDDAVSRKLSSKFLQVFGCEIDVAVDGVNAVNKMNLEQYDLVLMDIVMPNLDGVSATSLIREFDPRTPIISMTSNSGPHELLNYMSSGMNDILPKPFTKEGLLNMLEKHLIHLKTVQKMDQIPKQLGLPPVTKETLQSVLSATAASTAALDLPEGSLSSASGKALAIAAALGNGPGVKVEGGVGGGGVTSSDTSPPSYTEDDGDGDGNILNPLSGMGFSDEEYIRMMQSLIAAGTISGDMSDDVAGVMGVQKGEGASGSSRSHEGTPSDVPSTGFLGNAAGPAPAQTGTNSKKRAHEASPPRDAEQDRKSKARFSELAA